MSHGVLGWLSQNKDWVFSGIVVAFLLLVLGWLFSPPTPTPHVKADGGVAAGRNIEGSTITITGPNTDRSPVTSEQEK
ncbi:MAG: hypothetical protein WAN46_22475 [Gammaproteobacteria bacterium]